jgi:hypothetical protein
MNVAGIVSEGVDWIHMTQDRDQWLFLAFTVMNLWLHKERGIADP